MFINSIKFPLTLQSFVCLTISLSILRITQILLVIFSGNFHKIGYCSTYCNSGRLIPNRVIEIQLIFGKQYYNSKATAAGTLVSNLAELALLRLSKLLLFMLNSQKSSLYKTGKLSQINDRFKLRTKGETRFPNPIFHLSFPKNNTKQQSCMLTTSVYLDRSG